MLTQQRLRQVLEYCPATGDFVWKQTLSNRAVAGSPAGKTRPDGYRSIKIDGKNYLAHRLAWLLTNDEMPPAYIDHIDGNPSNNRICNLRIATNSENQANRRVIGASGRHKGVCWHRDKKKWRAQIKKDQRFIHLGYFDDQQTALTAYRDALKAAFGQFARLH